MSERHFTIHCEMKERWVAPFLSMLRRMQYLGGIGSSRVVALYADGDGDFQPHFKWDNDLPADRGPARECAGDYTYDADGCPVLPREMMTAKAHAERLAESAKSTRTIIEHNKKEADEKPTP